MANNNEQRSLAAGRERGFSLVELLVSVAISTVILGTTIAAMLNAVRANDTAVLVTNMNNNLRTAMDLVTRDLLQVGQGLPTGRVVSIPNGPGATAVRRPGPPNTNLTWALGTTDLSAVTPGPGLGPVINNVATDIFTTLAVDSAFERVPLLRIQTTSARIQGCPCPTSNPPGPGANLTNGDADDINVGDLIMFAKGAVTTLVQVTAVNGQDLTFAAGDSLNLNQNLPFNAALLPGGTATGTMAEVIGTDPTNLPNGTENLASVAAYRVRMITYYVDATTDPLRPRLVRRMGNGHPTNFNNALGTAVAFDIEGFTISYDLADGVNNPANVRFEGADLLDPGTCDPGPCSANNIRKVNAVLSGRSRRALSNTGLFFRNSLSSQVSLRSLAFVDRYR
jgi:prepilin-type N-terminal cleavage/methylation domain-containing protein